MEHVVQQKRIRPSKIITSGVTSVENDSALGTGHKTIEEHAGHAAAAARNGSVALINIRLMIALRFRCHMTCQTT
jgi:hypothetical protein